MEDALTASRHECAKLHAHNDALTSERDELRRKLETAHAATTQATGAASAEVQDRPPHAPPHVSRLQRLASTLEASEAAVHACLADPGPAIDFEETSEEELQQMREIRGRAAIMAMQGMSIMQTYSGALKPSMLRRMHVAAWRPREAGGTDAAADSLVVVHLPRLCCCRGNTTRTRHSMYRSWSGRHSAGRVAARWPKAPIAGPGWAPCCDALFCL
jgi:hypothetical protein